MNTCQSSHRFSLHRQRPIVALSLCILLSLACSAAQARDRYTTSEVSVALLYNVTKFVRWPEGRFDREDAPLRICTYPSKEYRAPLRALEKRRVRSHSIQVVEVDGSQSASQRDCHVWFFTADDQASYRDTLEELRGRSVLTVGNFREFAERGGMLSLVKGRKRVNIRINATASELAGLEFNAQLLELATVFEQEAEVAQQ